MATILIDVRISAIQLRARTACGSLLKTVRLVAGQAAQQMMRTPQAPLTLVVGEIKTLSLIRVAQAVMEK